MISIKELHNIFLHSTGIATDSRKISKDSIFFALKGANFNGNKYAEEALAQGALYSIVDEPEYATNNSIILVDNVLSCLQKLANYHRNTLKIPIIGITGTNGKTTTKELIATVLTKKYKVSFTQGNLNNHIGVPLTLLQMNNETEIGIVEMGANHPGEIADLCQIADPDYGIITNIGQAHLEGFGSFEGVKKTKAELYNHIAQKNGTIFINSDNEILTGLSTKVAQKISYGQKNAMFTGEPVTSPPFIHVKANFKKGILYLNSNLIGDYNFENILGAACVGNYFKVDALKIQEAIKEYIPSNNRSQLIKKGDLRIIMDAYNANPTSMNASIKSFINNLSGNNFMILGDMLELGDFSLNEHKKIIEAIPENMKTNTFLVGKEFSATSDNSNIKSFTNIDELTSFLSQNPIKKGNILIKGSRGIKLEKALDYL